MKVNEFIERLKYLESNRTTYYDNSFPSNCGEINPDGSISFDCIGLIKSVINEPDIAYKTSPSGYYIKTGQVIPDYTEEGLLNLCTDIHYGQFGAMKPGAYMCMYPNPGHAGIYVGEFIDRYGVKCNTIECTTDFDCDGVIGTWTDKYGRRFNHLGGEQGHPWKGWGYLSDYIDFGEEPKPAPTETQFSYQVFDDINKVWLPNVINDSDYAGIFGSDVDNVYISCNVGNVEYCVHTWAGDGYEYYPNGGTWLPWVKNREDFAGNNIPIDGIAIKSDKPCEYRVHLRKSNMWLERVSSKDTDLNNDQYGYAGIIGEPIDAIQIRLI